MVANLLGHNEDTNRDHYSYDTSTYKEQKAVFSTLFSNVLNFEDYYKDRDKTRFASFTR